VRAAARARPIRCRNANASASAHRSSKEWNPPGVIAAARGRSGARFSIHGWNARPSNVGIVGVTEFHDSDRPQMSPVPRGPNNHL